MKLENTSLHRIQKSESRTETSNITNVVKDIEISTVGRGNFKIFDMQNYKKIYTL